MSSISIPSVINYTIFVPGRYVLPLVMMNVLVSAMWLHVACLTLGVLSSSLMPHSIVCRTSSSQPPLIILNAVGGPLNIFSAFLWGKKSLGGFKM